MTISNYIQNNIKMFITETYPDYDFFDETSYYDLLRDFVNKARSDWGGSTICYQLCNYVYDHLDEINSNPKNTSYINDIMGHTILKRVDVLKFIHRSFYRLILEVIQGIYIDSEVK